MSALAWTAAGRALEPLFAGVRFELRYGLEGDVAVRQLGGPVAARHAEAPDVTAAWTHSARCGDARGWLLAETAPADAAKAGDLLARAVERHTAERLQRLRRARMALDTDLLERLTHRMRTDVSTLQSVTEGALHGMFAETELDAVRGEVSAVAVEAQRQLTDVREVMSVLHPRAGHEPQPLIAALNAELEAAGAATRVAAPAGEEPMALVPGAGWSACARVLAANVPAQYPMVVGPHPDGWRLEAGEPGDPEPWSAHVLGPLVFVGHLLTAAGGAASVTRDGRGLLGLELVVPAAPSRG